jgi:hypothetical protein
MLEIRVAQKSQTSDQEHPFAGLKEASQMLTLQDKIHTNGIHILT